jgi:hypothetical protein
MPRFNGDIRLDGKLIFPSGAENTMAIRSFATESATGQPASGQIRFLSVGNEEGYWYLFNHPTADLYDFDAAALPSGARVATLDDINAVNAGVISVNGLDGAITIVGASGIGAKVDVDGVITINASGLDVIAGNGMVVSEETLFNGERLWRVSANQTYLEGELTNGSFASGLVRLTSPSGTVELRTVGGQVQIDVNLDVINSGLALPTGFTSGVVIASTVWNATHNFNSEIVMVQAYDDDKRAIYPDEIEIINSDNVRLTWNTAQTGTIVVIQ